MVSASTISLLIPCYNAAIFLPRLVDSVRAMKASFGDILCYDDGSIDDTVEVARRLGLKIITGNPNAGVAIARNRLVHAAKTEWIHFHDADDLITPEFLTTLGPFCNDGCDVVSCDADWIDEDSRKMVIAWRYDAGALRDTPFPHLLTRAMGLNSSIIRRDSWNAIGGCDEALKMWEDADVHIRLARNGARFVHVPEVLTYSLRRADSFSHDYRKSWNCRVDALKRYDAVTEGVTEGVRSVLASEAEIAAAQLALLSDREGAEIALELCRRCGGDPPTSSHPVVKLLKRFVSDYDLLRWQARRRSGAK